jgi:long-chain acyl-CoA synthetase
MFVAWSLMEDRLADAWSTVHTAVCGAAPLTVDVARRFTDTTGKTVHQGYGLTEASPVLTSTLASPTVKPGSIGRAIPGVSLRLVDASGDDVSPGEDDFAGGADGDPGEIVVRGDNLFQGYWPQGLGGPEPDGWWATGDIAYADEDGDLFLVDRLGDLILVSGFNVYPREVELVLNEHPAVAESAVTGVPHPYTGQTVKAFVVRSASVTGALPVSTSLPVTGASPVTADDLVTFCEQNLARFKCPTIVEFVESLPHSPTGKVRKVLLE